MERIAVGAGLSLYIYVGSEIDIRIGLAGYFLFVVLWGLVKWRTWRAWRTGVTSYVKLYSVGLVLFLLIPELIELANGQTTIVSWRGAAIALGSAYVLGLGLPVVYSLWKTKSNE